MTLLVQTARISYDGPDRLDVTRKSGVEGLFLAPSWAILRPALEARKHAEKLEREAYALTVASLRRDPTTQEDDARWDLFARAEAIKSRAWDAYVPAYLDEMRRSYRAHRAAWDALLARERVVLACYCVDRDHCHGPILRTQILPKLGAVDGGEVS